MDPYPALVYALAGVLAGDLLPLCHRSCWPRASAGPLQHVGEVDAGAGEVGPISGISIYLQLFRWLLTPLAIPTKVPGRAGGYPLRKFLAFDIAGELTWLLLLGGLGYAFSTSSAISAEVVGAHLAPLVGVAVGCAGIYWLVRRWNYPELLRGRFSRTSRSLAYVKIPGTGHERIVLSEFYCGRAGDLRRQDRLDSPPPAPSALSIGCTACSAST